MQKLFTGTMFDVFEVRGITVSHFVRLEIDGAKIDGESRQFIVWTELKPYVANFIKGKEKPKSIKIIFSAPRGTLGEISPGASAAFLNMEYRDGEIRFTSAISQKAFSLGRENDKLWDDYAKNFFMSNGVVYEEES